MATPSHVSVAPDSTGKAIDAQEVTSTESGAPSTYRQTVTLGDPNNYGNVAAIGSDGSLYIRADEMFGVFNEMLHELRLIRYALTDIGDLDMREENEHS